MVVKKGCVVVDRHYDSIYNNLESDDSSELPHRQLRISLE